MAENNLQTKEEKNIPVPQGGSRAQKTPEVQNNGGLPRIRTYAADMSRAIRTRGETLASIVASEKKRPAKILSEEEVLQKRKNIFIVSGAFLFFVLGIGAIAGVSYFIRDQYKTPSITENIIFANRTISIEVNAENVREKLALARANTDMSLGEVARLVPTENGVILSPQETAIRIGLPGTLAREVTDVMVGIHSFDRNQPFILMEIAAYDRSFNALLGAEAELGRNLQTFFAPHNATGESPRLLFHDAVLRNIDVRQSDSVWPILYSYPQRTLLVITTNEFTLREIISRLSNRAR